MTPDELAEDDICELGASCCEILTAIVPASERARRDCKTTLALIAHREHLMRENKAAWLTLGTTEDEAADDPDTARLCDSIQISLQYERDKAQQAYDELAAAKARIAELESRADSYGEMAIVLSEIGDSVIRIAESAMGGNDHWCEQADRFQCLAAFCNRATFTPKQETPEDEG